MTGRLVLVERYELDIIPVGRGGMGEVYAGYDRHLDRRVAVKLIRFPYGQYDETLVKRFVHETRVMAKLDHPGAPAIYDANGYQDPRLGTRPFLVMQYVDGVTIDHLVGEQGPLPVAWAALIAAQAAAVLQAAHERGIFHRDLKPSNLMLCPDGSVKVLDFGLAMFHDPELSRLTRSGTILGTPSYMSPEQVRGATVGPQSDIYSLGLVLHEMLTGCRLFEGDTEYNTFDKQVNDPAPPVRQRRPDVPPDLDAFLLGMLSKRAEDRPSQAGAVVDGLLPFTTGLRPITGVVTSAPSALRMYAGAVSRVIAGVDNPAAAEPHGGTPPDRRDDPPASRASSEDGFGRDDIARARTEARALADDSRYGQAVEVLSAVLDTAHRMFGALDKDVLDLRIHLAEVLFEGGDYRRAAPAFAELSTDLARRHGPGDEVVLHCRRQEATCLALMGRTGEALGMLESLLADELYVFGDEDSRPLELRRQIGLLQLGAGDTDRARATLTDLLGDLSRLYGEGHPEALRVRDNLSRLTM
ncbi:serine/threonine-protein kinase [Sphaerisporangium rubeum]|uniref:non-specific serine/threonine protein kinase n=1 Tax=Sphaerisporangium rubeum TaxID=321317 RepID=A0A7X0IHL8_9ACTN|nr:serine/threonine-protein kinase [Sphaerisporangium rubeum]MBB6474819.1 tRNA A-37 threonylcarbamoyl transferase component Bud32 [Sphaerisporangium rubeum]